jgi:hypothetical protein
VAKSSAATDCWAVEVPLTIKSIDEDPPDEVAIAKEISGVGSAFADGFPKIDAPRHRSAMTAELPRVRPILLSSKSRRLFLPRPVAITQYRPIVSHQNFQTPAIDSARDKGLIKNPEQK